MGPALVCPRCARAHPDSERFCDACGMPLVHAQRAASGRPSERELRARKIKPQFTEGPLVKVARAANQVEAEFIEGLLLEEGIPSMLRRAPGFDVPDFLAAGPRDVLVAASAEQAAREALSWQRPGDAGAPGAADADS